MDVIWLYGLGESSHTWMLFFHFGFNIFLQCKPGMSGHTTLAKHFYWLNHLSCQYYRYFVRVQFGGQTNPHRDPFPGSDAGLVHVLNTTTRKFWVNRYGKGSGSFPTLQHVDIVCRSYIVRRIWGKQQLPFWRLMLIRFMIFL